MFSSRKTQAGFTLIEMIVSLAIFSIIVTMTIGALLVLITSNQKLQSEQSVMANLSFALDSMTREIRTGTSYYCDDANNDTSGVNNIFRPGDDIDGIIGVNTKPCATGSNKKFRGVSFIEAGNSITEGIAPKRILYYFEESAGGTSTLKRKVGSAAGQSMVSSGLEIVSADFIVSGEKPKSDGNNLSQPTVTIQIKAKEIGNSKLYYLQTTVTQRTLDL